MSRTKAGRQRLRNKTVQRTRTEKFPIFLGGLTGISRSTSLPNDEGPRGEAE
jgi:hypothetical protein